MFMKNCMRVHFLCVSTAKGITYSAISAGIQRLMWNLWINLIWWARRREKLTHYDDFVGKPGEHWDRDSSFMSMQTGVKYLWGKQFIGYDRVWRLKLNRFPNWFHSESILKWNFFHIFHVDILQKRLNNTKNNCVICASGEWRHNL